MESEDRLSDEALHVGTYSSRRLEVSYKARFLLQRARYFFKKRPSAALIGQQEKTPDSNKESILPVLRRNEEEHRRHPLRRKAISLTGSFGFRRRDEEAIFDCNLELWSLRRRTRTSAVHLNSHLDLGGIQVSSNDSSEHQTSPMNRNCEVTPRESAFEDAGAPRLPPLATTVESDGTHDGILSLESLFLNTANFDSPESTKDYSEPSPRQHATRGLTLRERVFSLPSNEDTDNGTTGVSLGNPSRRGSDSDSVCRTPNSKRGSIEEILWGSRDFPVRRGTGSLKKVLKPLHHLKEYASRYSIRLPGSKKVAEETNKELRSSTQIATVTNNDLDLVVEKSRPSAGSVRKARDLKDMPEDTSEEDIRTNPSQRLSIRLIGGPSQQCSISSGSIFQDSETACEDFPHSVGVKLDTEIQASRGIHETTCKHPAWTSPNTSEWSNAGTDELPNWHSYYPSYPSNRLVRLPATDAGPVPQNSTSGNSHTPSLD